MAESSLSSARELRLQTIQGVFDLMQSAGTFAPERDAIMPHSNGYSCWFVPYDPKPLGTHPISKEEILRRIEAREALPPRSLGERFADQEARELQRLTTDDSGNEPPDFTVDDGVDE